MDAKSNSNKKKFFKINVEISNICNLQCSFCPEVLRPKQMMTLDLFKKIIPQIAPLTELICFHLMGDPLVHPNLSEFISLCEEHKVKIFFVTNGVLLKPEHKNILTQKIFHQVNFSLHSFFDNHPGKDPSTYLNKIFTWTDFALQNNPDLYINYRLWNLQDTRGQATENQKMLEAIQDKFSIKIDPTHINLKKNKSFPIQGRLYLHFDSEFTWPSLDLPVLGNVGTCYGLKNHFGILADGTVVPCCLDKEGAIPLGNMTTNSLTAILNSEKTLRIIDGFNKHVLHEELCQKCQYIDRFGRI